MKERNEAAMFAVYMVSILTALALLVLSIGMIAAGFMTGQWWAVPLGFFCVWSVCFLGYKIVTWTLP